MYRQEHKNTTGTFCVSYLAAPSVLKFSKLFGILLAYSYLCTVKRNKGTIMGYSNHDKMEWALIFAMEFGRRFGLTLKQAFNYLSRFGAIKFIDEHAIFAILRAAAKKALGQFSLASEFEFNPSDEIDFSPAPKGYIPPEPKISYNHSYNPFSSSQHHENVSHKDTREWDNFFDTKPVDKPAFEPTIEACTPTLPSLETQQPSMTSACMQVQGRYIVSAMASGVIVVDQQRAHERIIYDRLMNRNAGTPHPQQLLFPVNCSFTPADADIFNELLPDIKARGFEIEPLGQCTFVVTATPTDVADTELQQLFDQTLAEYKSSMLQKFSNRDQCLCRSLARQMAVKAGRQLEQEEMQQIMVDLFSSPMPDRSPDGRKTFVVIDPKDLLN